MRALTALPVATLALLTAACGGAGSDAETGPTATRDSAGVTIVDNGAPAWPEGGGFVVEPAPDVESETEGQPEATLEQPARALRMADGSWVVLDGQARTVKRYGADGSYLGALGRQGEGPGEFQAPIFLGQWLGDSLVTFDILTRRWQVFGPDLAFARQQVVEWEIGPGRPLPPQPQGVFADGTILARQGTRPEFPFEGTAGEVRQDSVRLVRLALDGTEVDSLGVWPSGQTFGVELTFGGNSMLVPSQVPLAPMIGVAVAGTRAYIGAGQRWEIVVLDGTGQVERIVRREVPALPVEAALRDSAREAILDVLSGLRGLPPQLDSAMREAVRNSPFPDHQPAHGRLLVDEEGFIWVEGAAGLVPGSTQPGSGTWSVLSPEGIYQGDVAMPEGLGVLAIGRDWVVGSWRDADDVGRLRVHRLRRPGVAADG